MSASFTNQVLAQIELAPNHGTYEQQVYMLPKHLDEKVARLHPDHLGARPTELTEAQADYTGVPKDGPFKPDHSAINDRTAGAPPTGGAGPGDSPGRHL